MKKRTENLSSSFWILAERAQRQPGALSFSGFCLIVASLINHLQYQSLSTSIFKRKKQTLLSASSIHHFLHFRLWKLVIVSY